MFLVNRFADRRLSLMLPTRRIAVLGHIHSYVVVACLKQWFSAAASFSRWSLVGLLLWSWSFVMKTIR